MIIGKSTSMQSKSLKNTVFYINCQIEINFNSLYLQIYNLAISGKIELIRQQLMWEIYC